MDNLEAYESAPFAEKRYVSDGIIQLIHKQGGLFLKEEEAWWIEADEETVRNRVSEHRHSCGLPVISSMDCSATDIVCVP